MMPVMLALMSSYALNVVGVGSFLSFQNVNIAKLCNATPDLVSFVVKKRLTKRLRQIPNAWHF
ncbi:hypothetical protein BCU70_11385 [Vibrio sp. 10N.286.49.C2]|nr:hypothetical protein BCU70_11385 [Vibrio sp. 10N.286.49.C2]PMH45283.1 hypothetical protein BCU66_02985 [Vibrio sp. 10N.286.49.B1]PMH80004.1 hypothetical protein BCU58_24355 [Vibrio sp. 10N.286.48.B7]